MQLGHQAVTAMSTVEAEQSIAEGNIDLALVDYKLTDGDSEAFMSHLKAAGIPFIVCSGMLDESQRGSVSRQAPFLSKPFSSEALMETVSAMIGGEQGSTHVQ
jgi:DNA-binding NtrC family response regulator